MAGAVHARETRHFARELKFLVDEDQVRALHGWARAHLARDSFGSGPHGDEYTTTSLYFETPEFDVYHRRGSYGRSKFRIRRYGAGDTVFLERKFRTNRLLAKRRTTVPIVEMDNLAAPAPEPCWPGYWFHRRVLLRGLHPLIQMSYDRTARVGISDTGPVRMTIDTNLRVLPMPDRAFIPGVGFPLIEGRCIVELKYRVAVPALFKQMVERFALAPGRISKYRLGLGVLDYAPMYAAPAAARES
ncbi:MAG: polyphosphate polymerase domain-containing protein [Rhodospirillaceae bacterium]